MQKLQSSPIPSAKTVLDLNGCHPNDDKGDHCGYCHGTKPDPGHTQWGITSPRMSVLDYQKLMDRGWRRCGSYYYKYDFEKSCCQPYTIKLQASEYQISKSQKKVIKKFNKYLCGEIGLDGKAIIEEVKNDDGPQQYKMEIDQNQEKQNREEEKRNIIKVALQIVMQSLGDNFLTKEVMNEIARTSQIAKSRDKTLKDTQTWTTNTLIKLFYKLKEMKVESDKISDIKSFIAYLRNNCVTQIQEHSLNSEQVQLEDSGFLTFVHQQKDNMIQSQPPSKQKITKATKSEIEEEKNSSLYSDELNYTQYFNEFAPLTPEQLSKGLKHRYTVQLTKAVMSKESYLVYQKYQETVHKEPEKSESGYAKFLCESPLFDPTDKEESERDPLKKGNLDLHRSPKDVGVWPEHLGSYHMIHRLDGEIFAVGVLDYTPQVLSSVYLYYDPKYEFLTPGTFTAVREIEYVLRIQEVFNPEFKFYYMGLYFQDCQKSVYKATYRPSQVLCPHTYHYVYLTDEVKEKISKEKYPRLCEDKNIINELNLNQSQIANLTKNFKFYLRQNKEMMKIEDLMPKYQKVFIRIVSELYKTLGLDVMLSTVFIL